MSHPIWQLPLQRSHEVARRAGALVFVGGAGDFDAGGDIRHPGDLAAQIAGTMDNVAAALAIESCSLADVVRLKVFYRPDATDNEWQVTAAVQNAAGGDPPAAITVHPVPLSPFPGQLVQVQAIANPGWRASDDVRCVLRPVPAAQAGLFRGPAITAGLRAHEFIAVPARTASDDEDAIEAGSDAVAQSHTILRRHEAVLKELGASFQDAVKMEGYYFGTDIRGWQPLAEARASWFREPGPVATVVPCHALRPQGALTKIEVLAMRERWNGFDKYIPREDRWPRRVWDWPTPLPYRQGIRLRDSIWTGGQVPWQAGRNTGEAALPGQLLPQTRFTMRYMDDILRAFGAVSSDYALLVCYFTSTGTPQETQAFLGALADCVQGPLPPVTVVPQPHMHTADMTVEIWGVARG